MRFSVTLTESQKFSSKYSRSDKSGLTYFSWISSCENFDQRILLLEEDSALLTLLSLLKDVRDVLAQSVRPGTSSQYNSCWQYFVNWCITRETDPAEVPLAEVLEMFSHLLRERGLAYIEQ